MNCLSLDHKNAGIAVRQTFAFTSAERAELYRAFVPLGGCVLLVTCNRTEIYFVCGRSDAESILRDFTGRDLKTFVFYENEDAVSHLFRLAAGLESMLLGEDEILGQIRSCYEESRNGGFSSGADALFQSAIACGKKVRSETSISSFACSVATLAANEVFRFSKKDKTVLVVGATGNIGSSVLKNLIAKGGLHIIATSRNHGYFARSDLAETADYSERYDLLQKADIVISCTASPHTVFDADTVKKSMPTDRLRLFIDLSVPPDIDREIGKLQNCKLIGIDELSVSAQENNKKKAQAALQAERIVQECFYEYFAGEAARMFSIELSVLTEEEKKQNYLLRKKDPAAFLCYCKEKYKNSCGTESFLSDDRNSKEQTFGVADGKIDGVRTK